MTVSPTYLQEIFIGMHNGQTRNNVNDPIVTIVFETEAIKSKNNLSRFVKPDLVSTLRNADNNLLINLSNFNEIYHLNITYHVTERW